MRTEFYRSRVELFPTFSLVLAATLAGGATAERSEGVVGGNGNGSVVLPTCGQYVYYGPACRTAEPTEQIEALRQFAKKLLTNTEENPQPVVDLLNKHFWDLV